MKKILSSARAAVVLLLISTILLGGVYPLIVYAVSQLVFSGNASGSLVMKDGKVIGSELLGQEFTDNKYFWGRLSATTPAYNATASTGSNLSPANPKLLEAVNARVDALKKADPDNKAKIPVDLVTASASGLDPHISLLAAEYQIDRIAAARGLNPDDIQAMIMSHISSQSQIFGDPYVNVLELNLALDEMKK